MRFTGGADDGRDEEEEEELDASPLMGLEEEEEEAEAVGEQLARELDAKGMTVDFVIHFSSAGSESLLASKSTSSVLLASLSMKVSESS